MQAPSPRVPFQAWRRKISPVKQLQIGILRSRNGILVERGRQHGCRWNRAIEPLPKAQLADFGLRRFGNRMLGLVRGFRTIDGSAVTIQLYGFTVAWDRKPGRYLFCRGR